MFVCHLYRRCLPTSCLLSTRRIARRRSRSPCPEICRPCHSARERQQVGGRCVRRVLVLRLLWPRRKVGSKRSRTTNIKYLAAPFCTDNYKQHNENQHPERWKEYQEADDAGKKAFFEGQLPVKKTLHAHFGTKQVEKIYLINAPIVDLIIGKMLWDPEETGGQTHAKMMASFSDVEDESEPPPEGYGSDRYRIVINNRLQFFLAIDFLAAGLSFRQVSRVLHHTKERSGLASICMCSDVTISSMRGMHAQSTFRRCMNFSRKPGRSQLHSTCQLT